MTGSPRLRLLNSLPLLVALVLGLALRLLLWGRIPRTGLISDEGEYLSAASWLAQGRGFSWYQSYLWTRAPLYPLFVAAHLRLFGDTLAPIYLTQTLLSLLNIALVYVLARRLARPGAPLFVPAVSALLMALYLPFALYAQVLLSETMFITLLLSGFLALAWAVSTGSQGQLDELPPSSQRLPIVLAGLLFGLATLTRSLTLTFLPLVALWLAGVGLPARGWRWPSWRRVRGGVLFLTCAALIILPWTIYNSARLYGGLVVVDTSGAFNLMLGARTAYDGKREDAPPRNFMLALLSRDLSVPQREQLLEQQPASNGRVLAPACLVAQGDAQLRAALQQPAAQISQAARQQLMTAEGLCLIRARPVAFIQKSIGELVDLFQINYSGDERFADGFTQGRLPRWYALALLLLDDTIYVLVLPLAVLGWALGRSGRAAGPGAAASARYNLLALIGLWLLYNIAVAPLLFAINRFRLPLLPFAFVLAAYALAALPRGGWLALRAPYGAVCAALALVLGLVAWAPYAYFEPRAPGEASQWASYLGPYPSSLAATALDWQARPGYLREQQLRGALGAGDAPAARALISSSDIASSTLQIAQPLLDGLEGRPAEGLKRLPALDTILQTGDVAAAVVRADLLRRLGDWAGARFMLTQRIVDDANPVDWAWDWLHPPALPDNRIDLAGNLDLGYIDGCYLGEGDTSIQPAANFRWCTDGARLRFPGAGSGAAQALTLRADGRGWFDGLRAPAPVSVFVNGRLAGVFSPSPSAVGEFTIELPATPRGADVIVTLHMQTFVPAADRYLKQQGKAVVGQVQRLGVRLDWVELRN